MGTHKTDGVILAGPDFKRAESLLRTDSIGFKRDSCLPQAGFSPRCGRPNGGRA